LGALIEMEGLSHLFRQGQEGHKYALQGVDLCIGQGEFVAILGANGSGKSTLARHMNGLLLPTEGHCRVKGMDTLELAEAGELWRVRREVGMVFQNPDNQLIAAVVEDDVAFGPENLGVAPEEIRHRVHESLMAVGMKHFAKFAPHLLSGGQKQRIAIAGALAMQTECLVLDEPTAMLDPQGRREVMQVLERLHRERGLTVVLITHFMEEAARAERVVVMEDGRIVKEGTPREAFAEPQTLRKLGLEAPLAGELAELLAQSGVKLPMPEAGSIMTHEDLQQSLALYRQMQAEGSEAGGH